MTGLGGGAEIFSGGTTGARPAPAPILQVSAEYADRVKVDAETLAPLE